MEYRARDHAARSTDAYVFAQLIPYLGNKRKLLGLLGAALQATGVAPGRATFLDLFAGTGVVSRWAKQLGFRVLANDWEPYAEELCRCAVELEGPPRISDLPYAAALDALNALPPRAGWTTANLCPADDAAPDPARERLFFMRKNGLRIDAIRERIREWEAAGRLGPGPRAALLAPLLYQCSWVSNTSGVFKGFHAGWGGRTGTALHRIGADLHLRPAVFLATGRGCAVYREEAEALAARLAAAREPVDVAYLDPPYNQHPYGANYHVLNSVALWDQPPPPPRVGGRGDKAAIRRDWRTARRSAYNHRGEALAAYRRLLGALEARFIVTSYSTDGTIPLADLVAAAVARGRTRALATGYRRYRVSAQRPSPRPRNLEVVLVTEAGVPARVGAEAIVARLLAGEAGATDDRGGGTVAHGRDGARADAAPRGGR